jgi:hypothetical protein
MNGRVRFINHILFIILDGNKRWKKTGEHACAKHPAVEILRTQGVKKP